MSRIYIKKLKEPLIVEYDKAVKLKKLWQGDDYLGFAPKAPFEHFTIGEYTGEFGSIRAIFLSDEKKEGKSSEVYYPDVSTTQLLAMHEHWKDVKQYQDTQNNWITKETLFLVSKGAAVLSPEDTNGYRIRATADIEGLRHEWKQYEEYCIRIEYGLKKRLESYQPMKDFNFHAPKI